MLVIHAGQWRLGYLEDQDRSKPFRTDAPWLVSRGANLVCIRCRTVVYREIEYSRPLKAAKSIPTRKARRDDSKSVQLIPTSSRPRRAA